MAAAPQPVPLPAAIAQLIEAVVVWAGGHPDLRSVILLGSYARGAPTGRALDELIREAKPHRREGIPLGRAAFPIRA